MASKPEPMTTGVFAVLVAAGEVTCSKCKRPVRDLSAALAIVEGKQPCPHCDGTGYSHVWKGRRLLPERYGQKCRLLVARKGKYEVEFEDGHKTITVRGTFKRRANAADND